MSSNGGSPSRQWLLHFKTAACALLVVGAAAVRPLGVSGQGATGAVNGTITDSSGAVIPDAKVVLHNVATGTDREATTNGTGLYVFVEVLPGAYSIQISAQGFATAKGQSFTLNINQTATLNFALTIGPTVQEVTVAEAAAHLESTTAELGTAVASREVNELPLNGRNFTQLLTLTPGVSPISTAQNASGGSLWAGNTIGSFSFPSVNGQNNRANFFVLDGYNDQQSMLAMVGTTPIIDSVQEFKVQSHNDSSAYGFALGGIVNVATRSGTNQYHGDAWEFLRNNVLDANNYFNNAAGLPTVPYKQNQFGVVFGGPLLPGKFRGGVPKTWFFAGYEGFRSVRAASTLLNVPTAAELGLSGGFADLSGLSSQIYNPWSTRPDPANPGEYLRDPFMCDGGGNPLPVVSGIQAAGTPCNRIPQSLISTNLVSYVATGLPTPANTGVAGYNAIDTTPTRTRQDTANLRFDHEFSDRTSAWIRYTGFTQPDSVSVGYPGASTREYEHGYQGAVTVTHTFGGGAKVLTAGFSRNVQQDNEVNDLGIPTGLGLQTGFSPFFASGAHTANAATTGPMDPSIGIAGYNTRPSTDLNLITTADVYEGKADFTWIHGAHTLGMGFDLNTDGYREPLAYDNDNFSTPQTSNPKSPAGTGSSLASMLLGVPDNAIYRNGIETDQHGWVDGFYAQDTWKVMRNLTVNIGLRYEFRQWPIYGSLKDNNQFVGDMDLDNGTYILARVPPACDAASGVGAPCIPGGTLPDHVVVTPLGNGRIYHNTYDNFSPRLGLAYQLRPTTVIRAAAVKFYDNWGGQLSNSQAYEGTWPSIGIEQNANLNYPTSTGALPTVTWDNPFSAGSASSVQLPAATPFNQVAWFVQPNGQNPYSEQWNFGVQQSFGSSTLLEADYVGSHSSRLDLDAYRNEALTPGPGDQAPRRPFPYITPTYYGKSVGKSNYEALQLRLRRTTSKGLTYIISYTWSKNINLGCDGWFGAEGCDITQIYNLKADRSVAGFDQPQMFVASWTYDLPFGKGKTYSAPNRALNALIGGWSLNGIYSLRSGEPFNLFVSGDIPNVGAANVRPDVVGPKFNGARTPQHYFDTASFVVPQPYTFGNFGRNVLRQVWAPNFDMSVFRDFKLPMSEMTRLQFRAEFFNTWNNVALGGCLDTTVQDPNFGSTTCTRNTEREIQFAMKFFF